MLSTLSLLTCLASTLYMTGVIVFVQAVHYPLFGRVDPTAFRAYHADHVRRTTFVVMAPMVAELATSVVLVVLPPRGSGPLTAGLGLGAAMASWLATAALSVPLHGRLAAGFDPASHKALVTTNALRVAAWVAHSLTLLVMTWHALR